MKTRRWIVWLMAIAGLALLAAASAEAGTLQLPADLKEVGYEAFMGNTSIERVLIPQGVTLIRSGAFSGCDHLSSVAIPGTVEVIDSEAFCGCSRLSDVTIGEGVKEIRWSAFENCAALEEITLPASLESIGVYAFSGCEALTVHAEKHTYAYTWAVENGFIRLDGVLDVSARLYDGDVTEAGNVLTWDHLTGDASDLALFVHAEGAGTASVEGDWLALSGDGAFGAGDSAIEFRMERNLTGAAREGTITLETEEALRVVVVRQLPYLTPELVAPEALVGHMSLADTASASATLPYGDHTFEWRYIEGAVTYEVGLETPVRYLHASDGSVPFATYSQLGSDGAVPFARYRGGEAGSDGSEPFAWFEGGEYGSDGWEPFAGYAPEGGIADTFRARVDQSMLVRGAADSHRVFLWTYDAWGHRYSTYYDFLVRDGVDAEWDYVFNVDTGTGEIVGATITGYKGSAAQVVVPGQIAGHPVLAIDSAAFKNDRRLTAVTIPEPVTTIGYQCFYGCASLARVDLPDSLVRIHEGAFRNCAALAELEFPDGLAGIGREAFRGCASLREATLPRALKRLKKGVFRDCAGLETVELPEGLITVGSEAFRGCASLTAIRFPEGVTSIGYGALDGCAALTEASLPGTLESIPYYLFSDCEDLQTVSAPEDTFAYAWAVERGYIRFAEGTFKVVPEMGDGDMTEEDGARVWQHLSGEYCDWKLVVVAPDGWSVETLADDPEAVGFSAWQDGYELEPVDGCYPAGTCELEGWMARNITGAPRDAALRFTCGAQMETITLRQLPYLEAKLISPVELAENGESQGRVRLPYGDLTLEWQVGEGATLCELYLNTFDYYNSGEFRYEWHDTGISVAGATGDRFTTILPASTLAKDPNHPYMVRMAVHDAYGHRYLFVDADDMENGYRFNVYDPELPDWGYALQEDENGEVTGATILGYGGDAAELEIPSTLLGYPVTAIGHSAFHDLDTLTRVAVPDSVTRIDAYAFGWCRNLTRVDLPDSATDLGADLFDGCASLTDVRLPAGLTAIPAFMFYGCGSLTELDLPEGVMEIGEGAFGYSGLTRAALPEGVTWIGAEAYFGCESLSEVELPGTLTAIGDYAFQGCTSLTEIELPEGLTSLGDCVFYEDENLTRVVIPASVTRIGSDAIPAAATVVTTRDSAADRWAQAHGNPVAYMEED